MRELKVSPGETGIIDDQMRKIRIGIELGCKTYWIQKGDFEKEMPTVETDEPTKRIDSIEDLLEVLRD